MADGRKQRPLHDKGYTLSPVLTQNCFFPSLDNIATKADIVGLFLTKAKQEDFGLVQLQRPGSC